jgi:hypothetical protein
MRIDQAGKQGMFIDIRKFSALYQSGKMQEIPRYQKIKSTFPGVIAKNIDRAYGRKIFFSHRWDDNVKDSPPDPRGWQLDAICTYGLELEHSENQPACFWYDYCSLPQKPRTRAERAKFRAGLNHIQRLCKDCTMVALISDTQRDGTKSLHEMLGRGWILTELFVGSRHNRIGYALFENTSYVTYAKANRPNWNNVIPDLLDLMPYDNKAVIHQWLAQRGVACTNKADLKTLAKILHRDLTGVRPGAKRPSRLKFDKTKVMGVKQVSRYAIDKNGLSGHFPDSYFEISGGASKYSVTARKRPPLGKLGQPRRVKEQKFIELRIDEKSGKSPMYPGILFKVKRASASPKIVQIKADLLPRR